jgi:hypothetical protein
MQMNQCTPPSCKQSYLGPIIQRKLVVLILISIMLGFLVSKDQSTAGDMMRDVEWVRPRIGQRGTKVEIVIQGKFLADPQELVFYKPGIRTLSLETLPNLPNPIGLAHGARIEEQIKAVLEIDNECEPGEFPFRLRTATGLSLLTTFHVSPFPVIEETKQPNNSIDTAQNVPINTTVLGQVDTDLFRVETKPGERLSVEVDCVRIADQHYGDAEFDLAVRILDSQGRELAANDENALHVQDPLLSLVIPQSVEDGQVFVEVRQSVHSPRDIPYCIHIGNYFRPLAAYPAGGTAGNQTPIQLLGDPKGMVSKLIQFPSNTGTFTWNEQAPSGLSLRASNLDNVLEERDADSTNVPRVPIALNGIIDQPNDVDRFRLHVKKGDRYRVRVYASALGNLIDPAIAIRRIEAEETDGVIEIEADDADPRSLSDRDLFGSSIRSGGGFKDVLDPSVIWEPKVDGDYLLEIRDTSGFGSPESVYRIEIETPPNSIHPVLTSRFFDWVEGSRGTGLAIPQGNRWTILVSLPKGQGTTYNAPFELVPDGLPEGVRLHCPEVPAQASVWPIQLIADENAVQQAKTFTLRAKATDPSVILEGGCQQVVPFINHSGGDAWRTLRVDRFAMAVTAPAPFQIDLEQPTISLVRGGELFIPVHVTRTQGFQAAIEYQADFGPQGVSLPPKETIETGQNQSVLRIAASKNAQLGKGWLYVMGTTLDGSDYLGPGRVRVSSELIEIQVAEPFIELASEPISVRRGGSTKLTFQVTSKSPFEGQAQVHLLGLPKGVQTVGDMPAITKDTQRLEFQVTATDEALLGPNTGIECELVVRTGDQEIRQRAGNASLRIDPK